MKKLLVLLCWLMYFQSIAQESLLLANPYFADSTNAFTTKKARQEHRRYLIDSIIKYGFRQPLNAQGLRRWQGAFWAMELLLYKDAFTSKKLTEAWQQANALPEAFQKALLEVSYTLYPVQFVAEVKRLLQQTTFIPVFIRCGEYLLRNRPIAQQKNTIRQQMHKKFNGSQHLGLTHLFRRMFPPATLQPSLASFFSASFLPGKTVIYSLQRSNRDYAGLVVIRKGDGSFLLDAGGKLFTAAQLARAITNYPFYITNGNTPQGIFRWTGFGRSDNNYIGATTNLQMVMPFETTPALYFDDSLLPQQWTKQMYAELLPAAWKGEVALWEAYDAGEMGRSEIIMHGTAIDPGYYRNQSYFPQTPSLGCLCSYEEWDAQGRLKQSQQQSIVEALYNIGASEGYVVVLNIDSAPRPVQLSDAARLINGK